MRLAEKNGNIVEEEEVKESCIEIETKGKLEM